MDDEQHATAKRQNAGLASPGWSEEQDQFLDQPPEGGCGEPVPGEIRKVEAKGIVAKQSKIKPVAKVTQRQEFPGIGRLQQEQIEVSPRQMPHHAIGERQVDVVIGEQVVEQSGQEEAETAAQ
ncbi:MAG: hypothetical protein IPK44_05680 [Candidatus Accumulibacter sp.]|uniref:hypothetical protein n=1 Tax=Accumulibacter sp. TaxID=2053492 RepID=UPI00258AF10F|nr:hypothetical protein [Accumulibacter sp.]MBK8114056.1 hypothetical protein [Accumulibacter sp.]